MVVLFVVGGLISKLELEKRCNSVNPLYYKHVYNSGVLNIKIKSSLACTCCLI